MQSILKVSGLLRSSLGAQTGLFHTNVQLCNSTPKQEKSINQVTLLGRVGADPQKRGSEQHPVVNFSLATNYSYKYESGDVVQRTDWHRVSVFNPALRDVVYNFIKKGHRVYVKGKLTYGEVRTDDGQVKTLSTIIADEIISFQSKQTDEVY